MILLLEISVPDSYPAGLIDQLDADIQESLAELDQYVEYDEVVIADSLRIAPTQAAYPLLDDEWAKIIADAINQIAQETYA